MDAPHQPSMCWAWCVTLCAACQLKVQKQQAAMLTAALASALAAAFDLHTIERMVKDKYNCNSASKLFEHGS